MLRTLLGLVLPLLALVTGPAALAQGAGPAPLRVTVIVSDLGAAAARGRLERRVAEAWAARQRTLGGIFGRELALEVRSDGGSPERAVRLTREAIDAGVAAVVCCSTPSAGEAVAPVAAAAGVPLLSPAGGGVEAAVGWQFVLTPSDAVHLQAIVRDAYRRGVAALGVMTLEGSFGDAALARLEGFLAVPNLRVTTVARYPADAEVLTPEALWVATRLPDAIIVWGLRRDSALAVSGLRARAWDGPVYLRGTLVDPLSGGLPAGLSGDVRVPVSPVSLPGAVEPDEPAASWAFDARQLGDGEIESRPYLADGAILHDALELLSRALEQASTYGVPAGDVRGFRLAVRDALVAIPPVTLAAGRYELSMLRTDAALAEGLAIGRLADGRLRPLR